jgi:hypothetical protein
VLFQFKQREECCQRLARFDKFDGADGWEEDLVSKAGCSVTEADIPDFWRSKGDVAAVDPADLKVVRAMTRDVQAAMGQQCSIDIRVFQRACSTRADMDAVWYRTSMLGLLQMLPESPLTP